MGFQSDPNSYRGAVLLHTSLARHAGASGCWWSFLLGSQSWAPCSPVCYLKRMGLAVQMKNERDVATSTPCVCVYALPSGGSQHWCWQGSVVQILLALTFSTVSAKGKLRMLSIRLAQPWTSSGFLLMHVGSGKRLLVLPRKALHWRKR